MTDKKFALWNRITAFLVFAVSAFTYLSTIEPTASFWDCGEFIASSYKLEVGHPPGNPVFQLLARFFTIPVNAQHAAVAVNAMNAILSALTIFLLYFTIVSFAVPGWTLKPFPSTFAAAALKHSYSISPGPPPSSV